MLQHVMHHVARAERGPGAEHAVLAAQSRTAQHHRVRPDLARIAILQGVIPGRDLAVAEAQAEQELDVDLAVESPRGGE